MPQACQALSYIFLWTVHTTHSVDYPQRNASNRATVRFVDKRPKIVRKCVTAGCRGAPPDSGSRLWVICGQLWIVVDSPQIYPCKDPRVLTPPLPLSTCRKPLMGGRFLPRPRTHKITHTFPPKNTFQAMLYIDCGRVACAIFGVDSFVDSGFLWTIHKKMYESS